MWRWAPKSGKPWRPATIGSDSEPANLFSTLMIPDGQLRRRGIYAQFRHKVHFVVEEPETAPPIAAALRRWTTVFAWRPARVWGGAHLRIPGDYRSPGFQLAGPVAFAGNHVLQMHRSSITRFWAVGLRTAFSTTRSNPGENAIRRRVARPASREAKGARSSSEGEDNHLVPEGRRPRPRTPVRHWACEAR